MSEPTGLEVVGLTVRFGGLTAVEDASLSAPIGRVTGLIGPNGAGKTTTFDACTGLVAPTTGSIAFAGREITRAAPHERAQLGLGRTFQRSELYDSVTVRENVALGREAMLAGGAAWRHLLCPAVERADIEAAAQDALELCGLRGLAERPVGALSTGQRRLVELASVVAGRFSLLLLDEPSSGLDRAETARFGDILVRLVEERGVGVLLVEHDMSLVMSTCTRLFVLDFGRLIFEGSPVAATESPVVREAYLGSAA